MLNAVVISNIVLWVVVIAMAGIIFALVRQIGILYERVAPAGALMVGQGPKVGESAPVQEETDLEGIHRRVGGVQPDGKSTLLFFLSPTCPVCKTLLPVLKSISASERKWLDVMLASDGPQLEHEKFIGEYELRQFPYLLSTALGLAYRVGRLPHAVLIDAEGTISASGLVNSREHIESLFEASELGVASIQDYLEQTATNENFVDDDTSDLRKEVV
jgi:methylamine dehydrogenase accessory protein MauD